jgi:signal transduction histidine kinase
MARIRTRARAVDMLGRQQIATVQNAISELFKNAHDAYATEVRLDYFEDSGPRSQGVICVRDNGIGMTHDDFENKWLVLGTESKLGGESDDSFRPLDMQRRPITGEKGIGRLAIALLGSQVLVASRALRHDGLGDLVMCWVHWSLFELPGIDLEDIDLPIIVSKGGALPEAAMIAEVRNQLLDSINKLKDKCDANLLSSIIDDIKAFIPNPSGLDSYFKEREDDVLSLSGDGHGTQFIIGSANPVIKVELRSEDKAADYSFRKQVLGFYDRTFSEPCEAGIKTSIKRWRPGDIFGEEYLDDTNFFSRTELTESSDHFLSGRIDEFGQFQGRLRVYENDYNDLIIPWPGGNGKLSNCGPFDIIFGYLQGQSKESIVPSEEWTKMNAKLDYLGGIYVYRDGIRVLPYGDHSFDWLEVEKRRNKGAGHYFFSFRRMFGAVLISRDTNPDLQEKAGREGFQANSAYRDMRAIIINLLINLAAEFFRKGGAHSEIFERDQAESKKRAEALERQQKQSTQRRKSFELALQRFTDSLSNQLPESQIAHLKQQTKMRMKAASMIPDQDRAALSLVKAEQEAVDALAKLRSEYDRRKPSGVALTKTLTNEWNLYLQERNRIEDELFVPFEKEISNTLDEVAKQAKLYIDQRKRLDERIKALAAERKKQLQEASALVIDSASETRKTVSSITEKARLALDETIRSIQADMNRTPIQEMDPDDVEKLRLKWESQLTEIETRHRDGLMAARDMLASLAENLRLSDGNEPAAVMEALEDRMMDLEEQADQDFEMVQLGLAVAIINHEFAAAIKQVRRSIQSLGQLSRRAEGIRPIYESIKSNFEHLDGHLNLFTPLQRRLYRKVLSISGKSIFSYIKELFSSRVERHDVKLQATDSFLAITVSCYPSTLYPAIINIVDNAIYWVSSAKGDKRVLLDASDNSISISNNGPAIEVRDSDSIFARGFSRKPSGRGLGLYISKKALESEDMHLSVGKAPKDFHASFLIQSECITFES